MAHFLLLQIIKRTVLIYDIVSYPGLPGLGLLLRVLALSTSRAVEHPLGCVCLGKESLGENEKQPKAQRLLAAPVPAVYKCW